MIGIAIVPLFNTIGAGYDFRQADAFLSIALAAAGASTLLANMNKGGDLVAGVLAIAAGLMLGAVAIWEDWYLNVYNHDIVGALIAAMLLVAFMRPKAE